MLIPLCIYEMYKVKIADLTSGLPGLHSYSHTHNQHINDYCICL